MSGACATLVDDGVIRGVLAAVDCQTRAYAQGGYLALTTGSNTFQAALTALLTIYVALIGYRMLFAQGDVRLSDAPGIALKVGAILALVTSWSTFQTLVFDLADRAPAEIAALAAAPTEGGRSALAADPVNGLQIAYDQLSATAEAFGRVAGPAARSYSSPQAAAAEAVSTATGVLFLSSAGVISAAKLAVGVLTAVGPVFIALFLIPATRGLFVGWVRALAAAALVPMVAWLLLVLMLTVLEPWLVALAEQRAGLRLDPQTAMSAAAVVFVFGAGQAALILGACVMALGFRLPGLNANRARRAAEAPRVAPVPAPAFRTDAPSRADRLALDLQRDQAHAASRARAASSAAAAAAPARLAGGPPEVTVRLGDGYRRPVFTARRAGAAR
jgi:type IV secretion system protein VirB6